MALKKGILDSYLKEREVSGKKPLSQQISSKYSHNRVFDEPESLRKLLDEKENVDARDYNNEKTKPDSNPDIPLDFNRFQTVSNGFKSGAQTQEPTVTQSIHQNHISAETSTSSIPSMFHEEQKEPCSNLNETKDNKNDQNLNGFNRFQTVSDQKVSNGFNRFQTVSDQKVSNGFNRFQTVSDTVSKRPSLSEIRLLYYFQEIRNENGIILVQRNQIAKALNLKLAGVKTALTRLKSKGYINLDSCSRGRYTGYTSYALTPLAYQLLAMPEILDVLGFKRFQTVSDTVSTLPSSSSNKLNTTTIGLPEDWRQINFEILELIGFSETQLRQLYDSGTISPETVQDAINRFAYSLQHNSKVKAYNDPLNVLMGVLRKGQRWVEPNYASPKELALRQMLEEKRKQKEQRDLMIKELIELEFPDWRRKLTEDEIKAIVPDEIRKTNLTAAVTSTLRTYFVEKVLLPRLEVNHDD